MSTYRNIDFKNTVSQNNTYVVTGKYVMKIPKGTSRGSLKIYIPDIMGFAMGEAKVTTASINTSLFINSSECKPAVSRTISTQNFATASPDEEPYSAHLYYYGSEVSLMSHHEDLLSVELTNDIDNSRSK